MKLELQSASNFLVHLIRLSSRSNIPETQLEKFNVSLVEVLRRRYRDHWFPEKPFKGSGNVTRLSKIVEILKIFSNKIQ